MALKGPLAKPTGYFSSDTEASSANLGQSSTLTQPWIGLQSINQREEIILPDDAFELEPTAILGNPDQMCLNPADMRQSNDDSFAATEREFTFRHEAVGRDIDHMQFHVANAAVFTDHAVIDRMPV